MTTRPIVLTVSRAEYEVEVKITATLAEVLREELRVNRHQGHVQ
jgi:hypothetical protein